MKKALEDINKTNWEKFSKMADLYIAAKQNGDHILADKLRYTLKWALDNGVYWQICPEIIEEKLSREKG